MIVKRDRLGANPPLTATERREALVHLWSIILEKELRADLELEAKQTRDATAIDAPGGMVTKR